MAIYQALLPGCCLNLKDESANLSSNYSIHDINITLPDFEYAIPDFGSVLFDFECVIPDFSYALPNFGSAMFMFECAIQNIGNEQLNIGNAILINKLHLFDVKLEYGLTGKRFSVNNVRHSLDVAGCFLLAGNFQRPEIFELMPCFTCEGVYFPYSRFSRKLPR